MNKTASRNYYNDATKAQPMPGFHAGPTPLSFQPTNTQQSGIGQARHAQNYSRHNGSPDDRRNAAPARHELIPHGGVPQAHLHQVGEQVRVHHDKLAGLDSSRVQVACVGLDALVEPAGGRKATTAAKQKSGRHNKYHRRTAARSARVSAQNAHIPNASNHKHICKSARKNTVSLPNEQHLFCG